MRSRIFPTKSLLRLLPLAALLLSACNLNNIQTQGSASVDVTMFNGNRVNKH